MRLFRIISAVFSAFAVLGVPFEVLGDVGVGGSGVPQSGYVTQFCGVQPQVVQEPWIAASSRVIAVSGLSAGCPPGVKAVRPAPGGYYAWYLACDGYGRRYWSRVYVPYPCAVGAYGGDPGYSFDPGYVNGYYGNGYYDGAVEGYYPFYGAAAVLDVQNRLWRRGYYRGALDGRMNPHVRDAIRDYSVPRGLPYTGRVNAPLQKSLRIR